jgi:hypothetical protein
MFLILTIVLAMEVGLCAEPRHNYKMQEKYIQKLASKGLISNNTSVFGVNLAGCERTWNTLFVGN